MVKPDPIERILFLYRKRVEVGSSLGRVTVDDAVETLEQLLSDMRAVSEAAAESSVEPVVEASQTTENSCVDLDSYIDYNAMYSIEVDGHISNQVTRLQSLLDTAGIETYRDIVQHFVELGSIRRNYGDRTIRHMRFKHPGGVLEGRYINFQGIKTSVLLYKHLHSQGIQIHNDGYTPAELGEQNGRLDIEPVSWV